jgi:hypothetical protein
MEARRTFRTGARSSRQILIVVAALLAVVALGVAGAFLAKGLTAASAPTSVKAVSTSVMAPDALDRNAKITQAHSGPSLLDRNAQQTVAPSGASAREPIPFRSGPQVP